MKKVGVRFAYEKKKECRGRHGRKIKEFRGGVEAMGSNWYG